MNAFTRSLVVEFVEEKKELEKDAREITANLQREQRDTFYWRSRVPRPISSGKEIVRLLFVQHFKQPAKPTKSKSNNLSSTATKLQKPTPVMPRKQNIEQRNRKLPRDIKTAVASDGRNEEDLATSDGFSIFPFPGSKYVKNIKFLLNQNTKKKLVQSFPVNWPDIMDQSNIKLLSAIPSKHYVVAPKPNGVRYLLYIDSFGQIFLENSAANLFSINQDRLVKLLLSNGRVLIDTVLDGYLVRECDYNLPHENKGSRLVFVITDAIRCNGIKLYNRGIVERMSYIYENVIKVRFQMITSGVIDPNHEAFEIDFAVYKELHIAKEYLFGDSDSYPFTELIFYPSRQVYNGYSTIKILEWGLNDSTSSEANNGNNTNKKIKEKYVAGSPVTLGQLARTMNIVL